MKRKILVLEDEENIRSFLVLNLKRSGYEVIEAETGEMALEKYHENQDIAVAVLDVMLPGIDGYEVCRAMRGAGYQAGVIMLTARTQEADKVTGLMNGADDYVTKPVSVIELAARVDALYRRVSGSPFSEDDVIKSGPFKLNLRAREVLKNGVKIELTQIEYGLLKAFMQNIGKALSRDELLEMVWGHHYVGELKIVDVNIRRLRIKIEDSPADPTHIVTGGLIWPIAAPAARERRRFRRGNQKGRHLRFLPSWDSRFPLFHGLAQTRDWRPLRNRGTAVGLPLRVFRNLFAVHRQHTATQAVKSTQARHKVNCPKGKRRSLGG